MPRARWLVGLGAVGSACVVAAVGASCIPVVLRDGPLAATIVFCAWGPGLLLLHALGLRDLSTSWRLIFGAGAGLGVLSTAVLGLGLAGMLGRPMWFALMALGALAGGLELRRSAARPREATATSFNQNISRWLWLMLAIPAGLALAAASLPPGVLWPAEGNGYDVLEYHLAVPKEYWQAGRISYLPHNIYANFPFGVEMLYVLCMVLRGDAIGAAPVAQMLNVLLAALTVAAVWLMGRQWSGRAGLFAAILCGTCPMLVYLCGVAYVENGLLLFTALAIAAIVRASAEPHRANRWWLLAGLFAGFACGCKYTATVCVALPLLVCAFMAPRANGSGKQVARSNRAQRTLALAIGVCAAFAPWLIKNTVFTGSPVFPLARAVFHERDGIWTDEAAARWHDGHLPAPELRTLSGRLSRLGSEIFASELYGSLAVLGILACAFLIARRFKGAAQPTGDYPSPDEAQTVFRQIYEREGLIAAGMIALFTIGSWFFLSHLYGRFAVTIIPAAAFFIAVAVDRWAKRTIIASALVIAIAAGNLLLTFKLCQSDGLFTVAAIPSNDRLAWFREGQWPGDAHIPRLNAVCESGGRVLMVAEARSFYLSSCVDYTVVFNRHPLAEAAAASSTRSIAQWLATKGYSHVYVGWSEWVRLSNSRYGFWPGLTPELFRAMVDEGGLQVEAHFQFADDKPPYGTLFRVTQSAGSATR